MKNVLKILLIFLIIMMSLVMFTTVTDAKTVEEYIGEFGGSLSEGMSTTDKTGEAVESVSTIVGRLLSYLQVGTALLTVIIIASVGFRYIVETPEVKVDIKKTMLPIITGIIFVFFATSIAKFFMGLFSK